MIKRFDFVTDEYLKKNHFLINILTFYIFVINDSKVLQLKTDNPNKVIKKQTKFRSIAFLKFIGGFFIKHIAILKYKEHKNCIFINGQKLFVKINWVDYRFFQFYQVLQHKTLRFMFINHKNLMIFLIYFHMLVFTKTYNKIYLNQMLKMRNL